MQDLNDFYYFAQVAEHGGFAAAGRALGVPKSKLSRRVALLEERLGVRLLLRDSRHFTLTELGRTFLAHCRAVLTEAEAAREAVEVLRAEPRGVVRLACPVALLDADVAPMLTSFLAACPRVELQVEASNRRVDLLAEGLDLALRVRPPPLEDSDLVMRVFGTRRQCLLASPALLGDGPPPATPADLARLPSLALGMPQGEHLWRLASPQGEMTVQPHRPRLVTRGMTLLRTAALAGLGVAQLPLMLVRDEVASGALVEVLPGWAPHSEVVHAVYASRRGQLPAVRALLDHLAAGFAALPPE